MTPVAADSATSSPAGFGAKRKRVSRACDKCNRLGRKCKPSGGQICQTCIDYGDKCTYERPMGKRGAPPKAQRQAKQQPPLQSLPDGLTHERVLHLLKVFRAAVYPIFSYFSWPHFVKDVEARRYEQDPAFRCTVLAVSAVAAARIRDGAYADVTPPTPEGEAPLDAEVLRKAVLSALPVPPLQRQLEFDDLRASSLLHLLGVQNGEPELVQMMFGRYHGISGHFRFHDEAMWPSDLEDWQLEERRALYWSTYTSDVFHSCLRGGMVMHRGAQSHVQYPSWRLDEANCTPERNWIEGWNRVVDLYRVLERIIETQSLDRRETAGAGAPPLPAELRESIVPVRESAWPAIRNLHDTLPVNLKECVPLSGNLARDMYSFQAANINVTLQMVRMAIACANPISMAERCAVAGELLDTLARIPTAYMQCISAPFIHQLGSIGSLLGEVVQGPLTVSAYIHVRQILLTFGNILAHLEGSLKCSTNISEGLFNHVSRIDAFMQHQATGAGQDLLRDAIGAHRLVSATAERAAAPAAPAPSFPVDPALIPAPPRAVQPQLQGSEETTPQEMFTIPDDLLQGWLFPQDQALFDSLFRPQ